MLEFNIVNKLPDNKVLIKEKQKNDTDDKSSRYFIVNEDISDKFIKRRKSLDHRRKVHNVDSVIGAICCGIYTSFIAKPVKSSKFMTGLIKSAVGIVTAIGAYNICSSIDKLYIAEKQKISLKNFKAEEVTSKKNMSWQDSIADKLIIEL
ncbi:MAG: hypothetical protein NC200_03225 [Candidatus Gastranaerophilales bacterium]|nr:hypothetical protein [Candidatus Gastranaerophilales bacterium]